MLARRDLFAFGLGLLPGGAGHDEPAPAPRRLAPGLVAPGFVAPGFVAPGFVAPGFVAPGVLAPWYLAPAPDEHVVATERGGVTRLVVPARRARVLAAFQVAGLSCAALRLGGRTRAGEEMDLLAVLGGARVLALEPWAGRAASGAHFATQLDVLPGARGVLLRRDAAAPEADRTVWRRQSWTDYLVGGPGPAGSPLVDAPARPPVAATWQAALTGRRARVLARLARASESIGPDLLADAAIWPWEV